MEQEERPYSSERFRALARYLRSRCKDGPALDKAKLARLLFRCDFLAYAELGDSVTGAAYRKFPEGPYPECLDEELNRIEDAGDGFAFTGPELSVIEQALRDRDASGKDLPAQIESIARYVDEGDVVAYNLVFVSSEPPSPEATRAAQEVAERLGRVARAG